MFFFNFCSLSSTLKLSRQSFSYYFLFLTACRSAWVKKRQLLATTTGQGQAARVQLISTGLLLGRPTYRASSSSQQPSIGFLSVDWPGLPLAAKAESWKLLGGRPLPLPLRLQWRLKKLNSDILHFGFTHSTLEYFDCGKKKYFLKYRFYFAKYLL